MSTAALSTKEEALRSGHNLSGTALMIAHHRATNTRHPHWKRLCFDPFAEDFAGEEGRRFAERQQARSAAVLPDFPLWVAVRTAYFDTCVRVAVDAGYRQVVLLGAGFDTRSNRLGLANQITFFEVDAPGPQRAKRERAAQLAAKGFVEHCSVYVECDFETQCFMDRLVSAGFDPAASTLFIVEGVVYYLTPAAYTDLLRKIATRTSPDTVIAFDYFSKQSLQNRKNAEGTEFLKKEGEPFLIGINHPLASLHKAGFGKVVHHEFDELTLATTRTHALRRMFRFQGIAIAAVSADARMPLGGVIDRLPRVPSAVAKL